MKRLYVLLCFIVAWTGYAKGQGAIPPAIDFKVYLAQVDSIMCDSIYRVDTLYYPWEEDMQMIELRWKTVWKRVNCMADSLNYNNSYSLMPSVFIFRNKEGAFSKVYNNYFNFNIDSQAFKAIDFINTDSYKEDYIYIVKKNNLHINKDYLFKGLIDKVGNVKLEPIYRYINCFKETESIRIESDGRYVSFIDYNTFLPINDNEFYYVEDYYINNRAYHFGFIQRIGDFFFDNRGNIIKEQSYSSITPVENMFVVWDKYGSDCKGILNEDLEYIIPMNYTMLHPFLINDKANNIILIVDENNKKGLINMKNEVLIPLEYEELIFTNMLSTKAKVFAVKKDNKYGLYNDKYKLVIPIEYDSILVYSNHIQVKKNNKWSIYNTKYKKMIKDEFELITLQVGCVFLYKEDEIHILNGINTKKPTYIKTPYTSIEYTHTDSISGKLIFECHNHYNNIYKTMKLKLK